VNVRLRKELFTRLLLPLSWLSKQAA